MQDWTPSLQRATQGSPLPHQPLPYEQLLSVDTSRMGVTDLSGSPLSLQEPGSEFEVSYPISFSFISDTLFNIKAGGEKTSQNAFHLLFFSLSDLPISSVRSQGKAVLHSLSHCLSPCHSVLRIPLSLSFSLEMGLPILPGLPSKWVFSPPAR